MTKSSSVWQKTVGPNDFFEYQIGPVITMSPWLRPSYDRSKSLIREILELPNANQYRFEIVGGCLFSWTQTWDLDLFVFDGPTDPKSLESLYFKSIDLALNKYRIKLDMTYNSEDMPNGLNYFTQTTSHIKISKVRKQIGLEYDEIDLSQSIDSIKVSDYLIKSTWPTPNPKLIRKLEKYPSMVTKFNAELFVSTDESYFYHNSNHRLDN